MINSEHSNNDGQSNFGGSSINLNNNLITFNGFKVYYILYIMLLIYYILCYLFINVTKVNIMKFIGIRW